MRVVRRFLLSGFVLLALTAGVGSQGGYDISGNQVVISTEEHWRQWIIADGTVDVLPEGEIRPRFWRRNTNVATERDIVQNLRRNPPAHLSKKAPEEIVLLDAIEEGSRGSNRRAVRDLFDGSMSTFWEPSFPGDEEIDLASQAWFTVDLGRIVIADKIVLRFVEEALGDPFLLFDVLTSDGQPPLAAPSAKSLDFQRVHMTLDPNKSQRLFEIDMTQFSRLETQSRFTGSTHESTYEDVTFDPEVRKRLVRSVQVVVHGSALGRGQQVSAAAYDSLLANSPGDAGVVDHLKKLKPSGELAVPEDVWEALPPDRKGQKRYWRRERPRLAELEVWSKGDDILEGFLRRCQSECFKVTIPSQVLTPQDLVDGDLSSFQKFDLDIRPADSREGSALWHNMIIDLGAMFWVDGYRHMIRFGTGHARTFGSWGLDFSDGTRRVDGSLKWDRKLFDETAPARSGEIQLEPIDFEPMRARFMRLEWLMVPDLVSNLVQLAEMQVFGEGYQPEVTLTSDLIRLGGSRNLVAIEWDADTPPGTQIALQTRTGAKLDTTHHYFRIVSGDTIEIVRDTEEEAAAVYDKLRFGKGPIVPELVASEDWEPWSEPYRNPSGSPITSPSPRELLLIRATLRSNDPHSHATLRSIRLRFDNPVARRLVGELRPGLVEVLGQPRPYVLEVAIDTLTAGFDEFLVRPPAGMEIRHGTLYAGQESELSEGADLSGRALAGVTLLAEGDSLQLSFPLIGRSDDVEKLRLEFSGTLFSAGGRLHASLRNRGEGAWQRVDERVTRSSLTLVATTQNNELFRGLTIDPPVMTPNGDGVNEEAVLAFTVLLAGADTVVEAEIYDLSGRRVARLVEVRTVSTGSYEMAWDGRDQSGKLVPPGLYAVRLGLGDYTGDADLAKQWPLRTIAVAY